MKRAISSSYSESRSCGSTPNYKQGHNLRKRDNKKESKALKYSLKKPTYSPSLAFPSQSQNSHLSKRITLIPSHN